MDKYIIITIPLQRHLAFLKDLLFMFVSFVLEAICISVSLLGNREILYNLLFITIINFSFLEFF